MLYSQTKFHKKKPITNNAKTLFKFFSDTDNQDPAGSREPQDQIPYRTDLSLLHKVEYEEKKHHFTEK